jgi:hypothetical protein
MELAELGKVKSEFENAARSFQSDLESKAREVETDMRSATESIEKQLHQDSAAIAAQTPPEPPPENSPQLELGIEEPPPRG